MDFDETLTRIIDEYKDLLYYDLDEFVSNLRAAIYDQLDMFMFGAKDRLLSKLLNEGKVIFKDGKIILLED